MRRAYPWDYPPRSPDQKPRPWMGNYTHANATAVAQESAEDRAEALAAIRDRMRETKGGRDSGCRPIPPITAESGDTE